MLIVCGIVEFVKRIVFKINCGQTYYNRNANSAFNKHNSLSQACVKAISNTKANTKSKNKTPHFGKVKCRPNTNTIVTQRRARRKPLVSNNLQAKPRLCKFLYLDDYSRRTYILFSRGRYNTYKHLSLYDFLIDNFVHPATIL